MRTRTTLLSTEEVITLARLRRLLYLDLRTDYYQVVSTIIIFLLILHVKNLRKVRRKY